MVVKRSKIGKGNNNNALPVNEIGESSHHSHSDMEHDIEEDEDARNFNDQIHVRCNAREEQEFATDDDFSEPNTNYDSVHEEDRSLENEVFLRQPAMDDDSDEDEEIKSWKKNPAFNKYVSKLVARESQEAAAHSSKQSSPAPHKRKENREGMIVKSPSDTTVYAPALNQLSDMIVENNSPVVPHLNNVFRTNDVTTDEITSFIQGIRMQDKRRQSDR